MKAKQIKEGGRYHAKVNGKLVIVRVDAIHKVVGISRDYYSGRRSQPSTTRYDVTNLATGRQTTFRSAAKFRFEVGKLPATAGR